MAAETAFYMHCKRLGLAVTEVTRIDMNYLSVINKSSTKLVSVKIENISGDDALCKTARGSLTQSGQERVLFELHYR